MSIVNALRTSVTGMSAQASALNTIGENIANNSTVGYKTAGAQFESLLAQPQTAVLSSGPVQTDVRYGIATQGAMTSTTSSTDIAINGNGFFVVSNNGQGSYMTRSGSFLPDASGNLVNTAGYQLMGYATSASGTTSSTLTPVNIGGASNVTIGSDGTVTASFPDGSQAATYKIPLATVPSTNNLTPLDGNTFTPSLTSGAMTLGTAGANGVGSMTSGSLEQSTVDLGNELTNMIVTQRSYEANSKVLQTSSDLLGILKSLSTS